MPIDNFLEKEIRAAILNKIDPDKINKGGKHWKGYIYLKDKLVTKVKIPNSHDRVMKGKKSQYIAQALKLDHDQFNELVYCPLTGPKYYKLLEEHI